MQPYRRHNRLTTDKVTMASFAVDFTEQRLKGAHSTRVYHFKLNSKLEVATLLYRSSCVCAFGFS